MSRRSLSRRGLLAGLGAAMAVPFMRNLPLASAAPSAGKKRLLIFYTPNEPIDRAHWAPVGAGQDASLDSKLHSVMASLNPHRKRLLMIGDLAMKSVEKETHGAGHISMGHMLTGRIVAPYGSGASSYYAGGPSVDQAVAAHLGVDALVAGVRVGGSSGNSRMSYLKKSQPAHPIEDPKKLFDTWLKTQAMPKDQLDEYKARRQSVLNLVSGDLKSMRSRLPQSDWHKVDQHLTAIGELEKSLGQLSNTGCSADAPAGGFDYKSQKDAPTVMRRQIDVTVQALACNLTQVASLQIGSTGGVGGANGQPNWPSEGVTSTMTEHNLAHDFKKGSKTSKDQRRALESFYYRQFAYLLDKLEAVPEGAGTMLDNTLVFWTKHLGYGHNTTSMLYMLAGGGVQGNRFVSQPGKPHNDLLTRICHEMGLTDVQKFGDPAFCNGPLAI